VVVSPDLGNAKEASRFARLLGLPVAAGAKERISDDKVVISSIIGDVRGKDVVVLDDEIARGSTIVELLDRLVDHDIASARVACTHGLFSDGALERIGRRDDVAEIVCTNTVPVPGAEHAPKLTVLSIAPALAEAVRRIHNGESVSVLFDAH
jgi:ribose-phosphate pyrophosphokinase